MDKLKEHPRVLVLVIVAAAVLVGGLAYALWPTSPPPMPETMADVKALLEDKSYQNLSREQKRPYVQRVSELMRDSDRDDRRGLADSEQSRDAMRDMFRQMMVDRVRQFALADEAQRQQMIAEDRARMEAMRGNRGDRGDRPELTEDERQQRQEEHETRVEDWVNEGNGQEWALMREYWSQIRPGR